MRQESIIIQGTIKRGEDGLLLFKCAMPWCRKFKTEEEMSQTEAEGVKNICRMCAGE